MANRLLLIVLLFTATGVLLAQKVDFDVSSGKKKIEPLRDFSSRLDYLPRLEKVKEFFKEHRFEETGTTGNIMTLKVFKRSELKFEFLDFDLTNVFETIKEYKEGKLISELKVQEDNYLVYEKTVFNEKSQVAEVLNDTKRAGFFNERNIYEGGKIIKTMKDANGDGLFEQEFIYYLKEKPAEKIASLDLNQKKVPNNVYCVFGGFYQQDKYTFFDAEVSEKVNASLSNLLLGGFEKTKAIAGHIFKEATKNKELGKKHVTRLDIYQGVEQSEREAQPDKSGSNRYFILSGKVYKTAQRITVYYRVSGPDALNTVFTASFSSSLDRYQVTDLAKAVREKMLEYFLPVTNEKGSQEGLRIKNVNP